jgi:hypothetical protein
MNLDSEREMETAMDLEKFSSSIHKAFALTESSKLKI